MGPADVFVISMFLSPLGSGISPKSLAGMGIVAVPLGTLRTTSSVAVKGSRKTRNLLAYGGTARVAVTAAPMVWRAPVM